MKTKSNRLLSFILTTAVLIAFLFSWSCKKEDTLEVPATFVDQRDGQEYKWVKIGDQVWMAENLRYLPSVAGPDAGSSTMPYYYVSGYDGDNVTDAKGTTNYTTYGVLYNWPAAMAGSASTTANPSGVQGVCPAGWHLPSNAEWTELENYLAENGYNYDGTTGGGGDKIAKALAGTSGWTISDNTGAVGNDDYPEYRNKSGFTALPGGNRWYNLFFYNGHSGYWWSTTEYEINRAWYLVMLHGNSHVFLNNNTEKETGYSIRCVKD